MTPSALTLPTSPIHPILVTITVVTDNQYHPLCSTQITTSNFPPQSIIWVEQRDYDYTSIKWAELLKWKGWWLRQRDLSRKALLQYLSHGGRHESGGLSLDGKALESYKWTKVKESFKDWCPFDWRATSSPREKACMTYNMWFWAADTSHKKPYPWLPSKAAIVKDLSSRNLSRTAVTAPNRWYGPSCQRLEIILGHRRELPSFTVALCQLEPLVGPGETR